MGTPEQLIPPSPDHAEVQDSPVADVRDETHGAVNRTLYTDARKLGIRPFSVVDAPPETIAQWKEEIMLVKKVLQNRDALNDTEKIVVQGIFGFIPTPPIGIDITNDQICTLLAIALWVKNKKGPWRGHAQSSWYLFQGGEHPLEETLDPQTPTTCAETTVLIRRLASEFGIQGRIYKTYTLRMKTRFDHLFFVTDDNQVVDAFLTGTGYFSDRTVHRQQMEREWNPKSTARLIPLSYPTYLHEEEESPP